MYRYVIIYGINRSSASNYYLLTRLAELTVSKNQIIVTPFLLFQLSGSLGQGAILFWGADVEFKKICYKYNPTYIEKEDHQRFFFSWELMIL